MMIGGTARPRDFLRGAESPSPQIVARRRRIALAGGVRLASARLTNAGMLGSPLAIGRRQADSLAVRGR